MKSKQLVIVLLLFLMSIQLYIPGKMIYDNNRLADIGKEYRFRTAPYDPSDIFRGKYIMLDYRDNTFKTDTSQKWQPGETIYVLLTTDKNGFARISNISLQRPLKTHDYIKSELWYSDENKNLLTIHVNYPFDRYYIEEGKSEVAEDIYRKASRDTTRLTYAVVSIRDGNAVLKDLMIGKRSINDLVNEEMKKK